MAKTPTSSRTNKSVKKSIVKTPKVSSPDAKFRKKPEYKSFRLQRKIKPQNAMLSWLELANSSAKLMYANKRQLFWYFLIISVLNIIFVRGLDSILDVGSIKEVSQEFFGGGLNSWTSSLTVFGLLLKPDSSNANQTAQLYQVILLIASSLALIWLYRQQQAGHKVTMRMAYYRGMYPLVPYCAVVLVIFLQMLPALIVNYLYLSAVKNELLVGQAENIGAFIVMILFLVMSLYMITSTVIALYVVTLPEMTPRKAIRQAKKLVEYRRLEVFSRLLALILLVLFLLFILLVPMILFIPDFTEWIFFALTILAVPFVHGYLFSLYRELL